MPQVYAIVHNGLGDFIIAVKNVKGYFFHTSIEPLRGCVYYDGVDITNGPNLPAFPGGKLESREPDPRAVIDGAIREMWEETGVRLDPRTASPTYYTGERGRYFGIYFLVTGDDFQRMADAATQNLRKSRDAVNVIVERRWHGNYDKLIADFSCPLDNELSVVEVWNLVTSWSKIRVLEDNPATNWFYDILVHLRDTLYPVQVHDLSGRVVGLGTKVDQQAGPRYVVESLIYDPARLEGTGEYNLLFGDRRIHGVKFTAGSPQGANGLFEPMG